MNKPLNMDGRKHGIGGYNYGCRCDVCRQAKSIKRIEYRSSKAWEYNKTYLSRLRENNPEKYRQYLDKNNEYKRKSFAKDPEKYRWQSIHKKYKLTKAMYMELLESQNGCCAICQKTARSQWLSVDHDHSCCPGIKSCGECIRGLLCGPCNTFLGRVEDKYDGLVAYLEKYAEGGDADA